MTTAAGQGLEEVGEKKWDILKPKVIGDSKTTYLERVTLLLTPWFSILLHRIYRPDNQREFHDHPWTFFSFIFWGWYCENTPAGYRTCKWWNFKRAEGRHSIRFVSRNPVWTLVLTGPRCRKWGFWVPVPATFRCRACQILKTCAVCGQEPNHRTHFCSKCLEPMEQWTRFVPWDGYPKLNKA